MAAPHVKFSYDNSFGHIGLSFSKNFRTKLNAFTLFKGADAKIAKGKYLQGFTLAEVLITLGIIGIVAAMTLPSVIGNAQKEATAAEVKKFYNTINNAIVRAMVDYGDVDLWMPERKNNTYEDNVNFLKTYILPYIKYTKYEPLKPDSQFVAVKLQHGMFSFAIDGNGGDIGYYVNGKREVSTRTYFQFQFNKANGQDIDGNDIKRLNNKTLVEPYTFKWDGRYESLKSTDYGWGCNKANKGKAGQFGYCAKILQLNNWQFPKDYPW